MKNVKALLLSLSLVCLLATVTPADGGTIGTGGDRTMPTPTPAPIMQSLEDPETPADAGDEAGLAETIWEALVWVASCATLQ